MRALLYILMNYLNNSFKKDTNYYIALALAASVSKVPGWTLDQAAAYLQRLKGNAQSLLQGAGIPELQPAEVYRGA